MRWLRWFDEAREEFTERTPALCPCERLRLPGVDRYAMLGKERNPFAEHAFKSVVNVVPSCGGIRRCCRTSQADGSSPHQPEADRTATGVPHDPQAVVKKPSMMTVVRSPSYGRNGVVFATSSLYTPA